MHTGNLVNASVKGKCKTYILQMFARSITYCRSRIEKLRNGNLGREVCGMEAWTEPEISASAHEENLSVTRRVDTAAVLKSPDVMGRR